jgi:uncharacterized MAPEG superfamily protein
LEAVTYFSAAIFSAIVSKVPSEVVAGAAGLFISIRSAYTLIYMSPLNGVIRSLAFMAGMATAVGLFFISAEYYQKNN